MKTSKSLLAIFAGSLFAVSLAFAANEPKKDAAAASVTAPCCVKAQADSKACTHGCCVEAAKAGDNCSKCKGSGKIAKKAAPAK